MSDPQSSLGRASSDLLNVSLIISTLILLGVGGVVLYSILRYRARPGDEEPRQDFGNRRLEIAWTLGPALLLAIITAFTVPALWAQEVDTSKAADGSQPIDLHVIGHQWWWEVRYPATGAVTANEIHIPTGKKLLVQLDSADVVHDLWAPDLGPKMDAVPGQTNWMWLEADKPGDYPGACAEYCGTQHAWMLFRIVAQAPADYQAWLAHIGAPAATPSGLAAQGAQEFTEHTCINCHAINGTAAKGQAGPDLTHFADREYLGAGVKPRKDQTVRDWLTNPQAVKPGNHMPNVRLSAEELDALTAYMESLK